MPTGYTAKLMEKGQTFQEFVMTCARGMGASIMMRDDPFDAPIPERFEPSDYNVKRIAESKETIARLRAMTNDEKITLGKAEKEKAVERTMEWLEKEMAENERLREMRAQVEAWEPPTKDHVGLKEFMLQQIDVSKGSTDYIEKELRKAKAKSPMDCYAEVVASAERDLEYNIKGDREERERTEGRNKWLRDLRSSLNTVADAPVAAEVGA